MIRKFKLIGGLLLLLLFSAPAWAILHIELTQGMNAAIPIAIIPFANEQNNVPGNATITDVIKNDLQNSGQFKVITPGLFGQHPSNVQQLDFSYWRKQGVNDVVVGEVKDTPTGYRVSFQIVSLYNKSVAAAEENPASTVVLEKAFMAQQPGLRELAHYISDMIYQQLTGIPGIFTTKIAYILVNRQPDNPLNSTYTLEVADYDGFNPQKLLVSHLPVSSPVWSPDGSKIAYVSFEHHRMGIYIQDLSTGQRQLVSDYPGLDSSPAFSPDGHRLALILSLNGNPNIYVLNLSNHQLTQITNDSANDSGPVWTPGGNHLIFTSDRGGNPQIYKYSFANNTVTRVSFEGNYNAYPSYIPGTDSVAIMHREGGAGGKFSIASLNIQSGQMQQLVQMGYNDESPSAAPNGQMIIYATTVNERGILAAVSTNGQVHYLMPARDGIVQDPAWSPFLSK